jgi:hypothetical protein
MRLRLHSAVLALVGFAGAVTQPVRLRLRRGALARVGFTVHLGCPQTINRT